MWKGVLLLYAIGAGPTDQPIKTTGWGKTYQESDYVVCVADVANKAGELNTLYAIAGEPSRWQSACIKIQ